MKNVAFVVNGFPASSETFIVNSILNAKKGGARVMILPQYTNDWHSSSMKETIQSNALMDDIKQPPQIPKYFKHRLRWAVRDAIDQGILNLLLRSTNPVLYGKDGVRLRNYARSRRFSPDMKLDLVHSHFGPNGVLAVNAKLIGLHSAPIITTFHGYDILLNNMPLEKRRRYYHNLFRYGDWFTVNGPYLKKLLIDLGCPSEKISCIPMGIDTHFFKPISLSNKKQEKTIRLVSVGRLIPLKGHMYGLECTQKLLEKGIDVHYTIAGDGPERARLEHEISKQKLNKNTTLTGSLTQAEIRVLLRESDIFLMTSTMDSNGRCETQGVVTIEAQACGLPVVGFHNGGIPDTILEGKSGFLVKDKNASALAEKIEQLTFSNLKVSFSQAAREFVCTHFDLKETNGKFTELYSTIMN